MHVISGGGSGIGQALAWELAGAGQSVMILGRREKALKETEERFPQLISHQTADLTRDEDRVRVGEVLADTPLLSLVHNAGMIEPMGALQDLSLSKWRLAFQLNVDAALGLTQQLMPSLQGGRVLHVSTGAAHKPMVNWGAYCCSKAALYMLYQCWNAEQEAVSFGSVMPGIVDSDMQQVIRDESGLPPEISDFFISLKTQDKLLAPTLVARFLSWLLLTTKSHQFKAQEWDIYDPRHHSQWLPEGARAPSL